MSSKLAQRFFNIILLPNVRNNITKFKKLNYHLYMAVKKSMFKIGAFFKGFLLPLAEDATSREAIIIGSILQKMSINALDVAAALVKMTTYKYKLGNGYFIKVLLSKMLGVAEEEIPDDHEEVVELACDHAVGHHAVRLVEELAPKFVPGGVLLSPEIQPLLRDDDRVVVIGAAADAVHRVDAREGHARGGRRGGERGAGCRPAHTGRRRGSPRV